MSERSGENAASGVATSEGKGAEEQEDTDNTSERTTMPRMQEAGSSEDAGGGMGGEDAEGSDDCELAEDDGAAGGLEPKAQLMDVRKYDNDYSHFEQMDFSDDSEDERVREPRRKHIPAEGGKAHGTQEGGAGGGGAGTEAGAEGMAAAPCLLMQNQEGGAAGGEARAEGNEDDGGAEGGAAAPCPLSPLLELPSDLLLAVLSAVPTPRSFSSVLLAIGQRGRQLDQGEVNTLVAQLLREVNACEPSRGSPSCFIGGEEYEAQLPRDGIRRLDFPFEARSVFQAECKRIRASADKSDKPETETEKSWARLTDELYVHDMAVYESGGASEKCMLLSMADARSTPMKTQQRVLFLVSLGIRNDCDWGCFCVGRHFIAIDVLLPEATAFECAWLYDFMLSRGSGDDGPAHGCMECTPAFAKKLAEASGIGGEGGSDVYEIVHLLSELGGSNGRHTNAFSRFLNARAVNRKRVLARRTREDAGKEAGEETWEEEYDDNDARGTEEYDGDTDALFWRYPASPDGGVPLPRMSADEAWDYRECGKWGLPADDFQPIRPRLLAWLGGIRRASLADVVSATVGFGKRFSKDVFMEREEEMEAEWQAEMEAEKRKEQGEGEKDGEEKGEEEDEENKKASKEGEEGNTE